MAEGDRMDLGGHSERPPGLYYSERELWQTHPAARPALERLARYRADLRDFRNAERGAVSDAEHWKREYERVNLRAFEHRAEIERLRQQLEGAVAELEELREGGLQLDGVIRRLSAENEALVAENDALRTRLGGQ